jgi:small subunit ribosomal protein S8
MNLTKIKFLLTLKTCSLSKKESILTNYHTKNYDLIYILYKEGLIQSFNLKNFNSKILIYLRYYYNKILLDSIKIVSKPSLNRYLKLKNLYKLNFKKKLFVLSTSKGLKTLSDCKINNLGGKLLYIC